MSSRWYPLYQKGNPQLRIFLPDFWLKLVRPHRGQPKNVVQFKAPTEMSTVDIRNYLEKIYNVPIADVSSEIVEGRMKRQRTKGYVVKEQDFRRAFVTLKEGITFEFPDLFKQREDEGDAEMKRLEKQTAESHKPYESQKSLRPGLPNWFGI